MGESESSATSIPSGSSSLFASNRVDRPDAIVHSREAFLQACNDISSTWSKRLRTIYWDATTTFPEKVIFNIRQIQESDDDNHLPGLEHLCIDYVEKRDDEKNYRRYHTGTTSAFEHARRITYFRESEALLSSTQAAHQ